MDEILKRYMVSTAMFKFFQNETSSVRATRDALKCSKVPVEEVEACRLEASHSSDSNSPLLVPRLIIIRVFGHDDRCL